MSGGPTGASARFTYLSGGLTLAGTHRPGDEGRPPLVFLHGGGQTRHSWDRTATRMAAAGWETYQLDARGHGESEWDPEGDYRTSAFVGDLVAFTDRLDRAAILVGASLGGLNALVFAGRRPQALAALVLVDVVIKFEPTGVDRIRDFMNGNPDGFASLQEVSDAIAAYNPHRPQPRSVDGLHKNLRQGEDGRWRWHWDPVFASNEAEVLRRNESERLGAAAAENVTVPALLVRGMQSDVVSEAGLEDMRTRMPTAETVEVGEAGHMVAGDDNDVFAGALEGFLAAVQARA
jgi:non-heme chloroperoxidase